VRLFTAIELSDRARDAIVAEQRRVVSALKGSDSSLRLVRPEQLHVTLVFIGEVSEDRATEIVRTMEVDVPLQPFSIVFAGTGAFPPRGAPRVLYLSVTAGANAAVELHDHVARRLEATGVELERRPFRPHLTLGRWRASRPSDRPPERLAGKVAEVDVASVALFQSRQSPAGPTYTRLASAQLR
jgi:2'-5' RNA ligase